MCSGPPTAGRPSAEERTYSVSGNPNISVNRATRNASVAPRDRQSRRLAGRKNIARNAEKIATHRITRGQPPKDIASVRRRLVDITRASLRFGLRGPPLLIEQPDADGCKNYRERDEVDQLDRVQE